MSNGSIFKSKPARPLLTAVLLFICMCCAMTSVLSNRSKDSAIVTPVAATLNPITATAQPAEALQVGRGSATPQPIAIATATSASANSPEAQAYIDQAQLHLLRYAVALTNLSDLLDKASKDPALILSTTWNADVKAEMSTIEEAARGLQALPIPPPELIETDRWIQRAASETFLMTSNLTKGIDQFDTDAIVASGENMQNLSLYMQNALAEIQKVSSE